MQYLIGMLLLTMLVSCGDYNGDSSDYNPPPATPPQEEQTQEGVFRAVLNSENPNITPANGATEVRIQGDSFEADVFFGNTQTTTHAQHIHSGTRCPTSADDTNQDGVVDSVEATAVYGPVLVPLDSDLGSAAVETFPSGPNYSYTESASLSQMLANMNLTSLDVEGKVLNIHGVPESVNLPATAQGAKADFPIACGVLIKVEEAI